MVFFSGGGGLEWTAHMELTFSLVSQWKAFWMKIKTQVKSYHFWKNLSKWWPCVLILQCDSEIFVPHPLFQRGTTWVWNEARAISQMLWEAGQDQGQEVLLGRQKIRPMATEALILPTATASPSASPTLLLPPEVIRSTQTILPKHWPALSYPWTILPWAFPTCARCSRQPHVDNEHLKLCLVWMKMCWKYKIHIGFQRLSTKLMLNITIFILIARSHILDILS